MARNERRYRLYNRILFAVGMAALALLTLWNLTGKLPAALALEQETRCGIEEHIHTDDCYIGDVLVCGQKAHTHSESCYLILLEDNDVNQLLAAVDNTEEKSLDSVIDTTLVQALDANGVETYASDLSFVGGTEDSGEDASPSPSRPDPTPSPSRLDTSSTQEEETSDVATLALTNLSVTDLNTTIADSNIEPALTLNENLYAVATLSPTDTAAIADDGITTLAVDGSEGKSENRNLNIYVRLDDDWLYVGTETFSVNSSGSKNKTYTPYLAKTTLTNAITDYITEGKHVSGTISNPTVYYTDYGETFSNNSAAGTGNYSNTSSYTFGSYNTRNNTNAYNEAYAAKNAYTDLQFYTVTLDYSQSGASTADEVQYVQSGQDSNLELLDEYLWYLDKEGTQVANADDLTGIDQITTLYARPKNFTVTYKDGNNNTLKTVTLNPGEKHIVEFPDDGYQWQDGNENFYTGGESITQTTTLTATLKTYSVTFDSNDGSAIPNQIISHGSLVNQPDDPSRTGYTFGGWYSDESLTSVYNFATPVISNLTLYAKWTLNTYTVTMIDETGDTTTETVEHGTEITLPNDLPAGYIWIGDDGNSYEGGATTVPVTEDVIFTARDKVTATYMGKTGTTAESKVPGSEFTLPEVSAPGNCWVDEDGHIYQAGDTVTLNENATFTEKATLTVTYVTDYSTVKGDASVTVVEESSHTVGTVTDSMVTDNSGYSGVFQNWVDAETTARLPGHTIPWNELERLAVNGEITLTAVWDGFDRETTVKFYVNMTSIFGAGYSGGEDWTPELYKTFVGGMPTDDDYTNSGSTAGYDSWVNSLYMISRDDDATDYCENKNLTPYQRDQLIDGIVGESSTGVWVNDIPSDAWIFDRIKVVQPNRTTFTVDGVTYPISELNAEYFTLRWNHFKLCADGWHIDGLLIRKLGQITVDKEFYGNEKAIEAAEENFYIVAENGTVANDDSFTPYDSSDTAFKKYVLVLDEVTNLSADLQTEISNKHSDATVMVVDADNADTINHAYEWIIDSVQLNEYWRITENTSNVTADGESYIYYAEYSVYDTDGVITSLAEYGTTAQVVGKTFSLDEDPDQGLLVDFRNYYYPNGSLFFKKEDGKTGLPLGGAEFELRQGDMLLSFTYDDTLGQYTYDSSNSSDSITKIATGADGFTSIVITGFSYEYGDLVIEEVTTPIGYDKAPYIVLTEIDGSVSIADVYYLDEDDNQVEVEEAFNYYAELEENGEIIVVKNYSSVPVEVTVEKEWENPSYTADSVTVVLQANGTTATNVFPGMTNITAVLNASGGYISGSTTAATSVTPWSYTWTDLPAYANGEPVEWSVKEIKVGDDITLSDGVSFMSWIVTYDSINTDTDGDGLADQWNLTVHNAQRRPMLYIYKTDGTAPLGGVTFLLERVEWVNGAWQTVSGTTAATAVTADTGWLLFDNLTSYTAGSPIFYRLTETGTPAGYMSFGEPVVLAIDVVGNVYGAASGTIDSDTLDTEYVDMYSRYVLTVKNYPAVVLPETGGHGTIGYTLSGMLLMAAALLIVYKKSRRREVDLPDV